MGIVSVSTTLELAKKYKELYEGASGFQLVFFTAPQRALPSDGYGAATVLATLTDDAQVGVGGTFETPVEGRLVKAVTLTFRGVAVATGTPTWACLCQVGDDLSVVSTTTYRHDFTVGTYEAIPLTDIRRESEIIIAGNEVKLSKMTLLFPASVSEL
jgi:hypothetical protein